MTDMENVIKTLVYNDQISLTVLDTTAIVQEAMRLHGLCGNAAVALGKTLTAMTFMSAALKEESGQVSVSLKDGSGQASVSGNQALCLRGCIDGAYGEGKEGTITVIRDDGYSRPFVGTCAVVGGDEDEAFEAYFASSEQLPTYLRSVVETDDRGRCAFAGGIVLQPLPFADEETIDKLPKGEELKKIVSQIPVIGLKNTAKRFFSAKNEDLEGRFAQYKCNCSRRYIGDMLVTLGREGLENIIRTEGEIKVHCHYCNADYVFYADDVRKLFEENDGVTE